MTLIKAGTIESGNLKGERVRATMCLILDHSKPGHGPRLHGTRTTRLGLGEGTTLTPATPMRVSAGRHRDAPPACRTFTNHGPGRANSSASTQADVDHRGLE
jgi:hypothetical protein